MITIETKQINITTVYPEDVLSIGQLKTIDIRNQIIELWDKQPIITQFPEIVAIIEPTQQVSMAIQARNVIVSNQEIKSFEARDLENFLRLVSKTNEILQKPISAFGYNYTFSIPINTENKAMIEAKMKKNINLTEVGLIEADFISGGVNLSYMKDDSRVQITAVPQFAEDLRNPIGFIGQCNIHFFKNVLFGFANLLDSFKAEHSYFKIEVEKILS